MFVLRLLTLVTASTLLSGLSAYIYTMLPPYTRTLSHGHRPYPMYDGTTRLSGGLYTYGPGRS